MNLFGRSLSADKTLYAQWEPKDTDYYVVFWKQKATDAAGLADDAKTYDYVSSEHRTGKTGETVSTTNADRQKGGTANREYGYYFTYNENNSDTTATVDANGTTVLNVYYDRREITYNFNSNTPFTVPSYTGVVDGETVALTPDGSGGYTYQKTTTETVTQQYTGTRYDITTVRNNNNPQHYGVVNGRTSPVPLDRRDSERWYYDGSFVSWGTRYYGTHYVVSDAGEYGWINNSMEPLNPDGTYTVTTTTTTTEPYTGEVTTTTTQTRSASYTGLYGSTFSNWPDPGNGRVWRYGGYNFPLALTVYDPLAAYNGSNPNSFTETTITFTATNYTSSNTLYIYVQTEDGSWSYTDDYLLTTASIGSNGTWYPTETFKGFTISGYQTGTTLNGNGAWTPVTTSGSVRYGYENVFLRYARNQHNIHFISQGDHVTGRTENVVDGVYYDSDLSKYAEGGSAYYEPTNGSEGYYFAGWYADQDCQIPFDFNTKMPDSDITVYAKWDTYRVRTVLVPTQNNEHNDEVELANNQSLSFRMDYNEEISDANIKPSVVKRPGYKLIGWYYSPDFDPTTEVHFPLVVNKDTPGVDMNYQSGADWDKYGDNDGSHDNVRGILKLYAKWELDVDTNSVYVEYDVDDVYRVYDSAGMLQTTIPVDDQKYALSSDTVTFEVAEAPTEYASGFEFYRWVVLNPDGSESERLLTPGETASEIPSSFIYEETITDDFGQTTTIKKIRLKAKFNIESQKVTTVTFDGNGGVTNDSAQQESVTESYPINKDFTMKDGDSFVREGYTLLGWAFQREDGSKITAEAYEDAIATMTAEQLIQAGIYTLGQEVAADNLEVSDENNWDPLENTVYAVWEVNKYTVTVKKIVDNANATDADTEFSFTATASDDYTIPEGGSNFKLKHTGEKTFADVPYGAVLTFMETPASGYSIKNVEAKQTTKPDKTALSEAEYINLGGADNTPYTIKGDTVITYTNEKAKTQKVRIHKIGDDAQTGLSGAKFDLTGNNVDDFDNMTGLTSMDGATPANLGYLRGNDDTDPTLFLLPVGTYTLSETDAPEYYDGLAGEVTLIVATDGVTMTKGSEGDTVVLGERDADGVYTLTVTNIRKKATVTIVKNVVGSDADKDAEYSFTATGLTPEPDAFKLHGRQLPGTLQEGQEPTQLNTKVYSEVPYGTVFSIEESDPGDFDTAIEIVGVQGAETVSGRATADITVANDNVMVTYTNTRNKQLVSVWKTDLDRRALTGASFELYAASDYNDNQGKPTEGKTPVASGTVDPNGLLPLEKLSVGEYRLVETQAPAGHILVDSAIVVYVGADRVTATQSGNPCEIAQSIEANEANEYQQYWVAGQDNATWQIRVWNNPGTALPSTGGLGEGILYLFGGLLVACACVVFVRKRMA